MWATTKYVSLSCQSTGTTASITPEIPPIRNSEMKPAQNNNGVLNSIVPLHSVATQLKIFTPVGTAMKNEASIAKIRTTSGTGVVNMWCTHTRKPRNAIVTVEAAIAL